ncbi:MAG: ethanolamine utilization protein EutN/carboxysome structural protein CcmL [Puniceicoccaceae bacterium 5H]|nr:MAG: ethanolamine utilization protein EutN/carboxysome structural protein CcmL [Puniceicoccaceae bacterium 5H]
MKVCRVIGEVVLSHSIFPDQSRGRLCLVSPLGKDDLLNPSETRISSQSSLVTYDHLGVHTGDLVGVVEGGEATRPFSHPMPIDAYCACILDHIRYQQPDQLQ